MLIIWMVLKSQTESMILSLHKMVENNITQDRIAKKRFEIRRKKGIT